MTRSEKTEALKNSGPFKLWDILLFGLTAVLIVIIMWVSLSKPEGNYVSVSINGKTTNYYSLKDSGKYSIADGSLTLVIEDGSAYVTDSKCPDHYCEKTGRIKLEGQKIVCLPQEIVITVTADSRGGIGDLVTG